MRTALMLMVVQALLWPAVARAFDPFSVMLPQVQEGNQLYQDQHFDQALEKYENAEQQVAREPRIHFNRGDALFKLGRHKEAREAYLRATGTDDPDLKKRNYYNIGNTFLAEGAFQDAIAYYRRALELDTQYDDARFNLELALRAIQQQQQNQDQKKQDQEKRDQQKQDQEKQEKQDQEKQDQEKQDQEKQDQEKQDQEKQDQEKQDQEKQDQEKQDQEKKDQQQQDQKQKQDQEKQDQQKQDQEQEKQEQQEPQDASGQKPQEEPGRLSRAQIRDLLDAMRENEKPFQMDRFMIPEFKRKKVEKDW